MTIGEVAIQAGVNTQTIRFYERKGLVLPDSRSRSGYRKYTDDAVRRVRFIRHAQEIGFSLREIAGLLSLQVTEGSTCTDVRRQAEAKIQEVDAKLLKLRNMRAALVKLVAQCEDELPVTDCPIIEALEEVAEITPNAQ